MQNYNRKIEQIGLFLLLMLLLTYLSGVIHEQQKPVVVVQKLTSADEIPKQCIYDLNEQAKTALLYLVKGGADENDPWKIQSAEVQIKEETDNGYMLKGGGIVGVNQIVTYAERTLTDGKEVRVITQEEAEKTGTIVFLQKEGNQVIEVPFDGIPQQQVNEQQQYMGMRNDEWLTCLFYGEKDELPGRLCKWLWECVLFAVILLVLTHSVKRFVRETKKKLEMCYMQEFLKREMIFVLT